jgi:hypothetical protein
MNIFEEKVFKAYIKLSQSLLHSSILQGTSNFVHDNTKGVFKNRKSFYPIKEPYNPIKPSDLPLDKLLELHPEYRYNFNEE